MSEQEQHNEIRDLLRNLDSVKASEDFENRLHMKIIEEERKRRHEHSEKYSSGIIDFVQRLLTGKSNPWLVPATGFVALLFGVLYFVYSTRTLDDSTNSDESPVVSSTLTDSIAAGKDIAGTSEEQAGNKQKNEIVIPQISTERLEGREDRKVTIIEKNRNGEASEENISPPKRTSEVSEAEPVEKKEEPVPIEMPQVTEAQVESEETEALTAKDPDEVKSDEKLMTGRESAKIPDAGRTESQSKDTVKSAQKKLEMLNKKWLEELEKKINE